jgi:hypothetical protein
MSITIESAGSHAFDLGHLRRQGGEELVRRLLTRAGLDDGLPWRLQVQKKLFCNGETPPVRVVDGPKKWAVYLKIKPGDNNSCHYCSLLMPPGLQGTEVYPVLKRVEDELDRNWRNQAVEHVNGVPPGAEGKAAREALPAAAPTAGDSEGSAGEGAASAGADEQKSGTKGLLSDPDKVGLLLLAIREINQEGYPNHDAFAAAFARKLGLKDANRYEIGGVLTSLVRKDYIIRKYRGSRAFGYELTEAGQKFIDDLEAAPAPGPAPAAPAPPRAEPAQVIRSFGPVARRFLEASDRLEQIAAREAELTAELEALRKERGELCHFLDDPDTQRVLAGLLR